MTAFTQTRFAPDSDAARDVQAAIAAAYLNWQALEKPLYIENPDALGGIEPVESHKAIVRSDNGYQLGIVGSQYTPVQIDEAFRWVQPILDAGEARIISAGQVGGGRKLYLQAELTDGRADVTPGDVLFRSVVFANSHDGSISVGAGYSTIRVICQNTMMAAARSLAFKAKHTSGVQAALDAARVEFHAQREGLKTEAEKLRYLTRKKLSDRNLVHYVREVLSPGAGADDSIVVRNVDKIIEAAQNAPGATPGTLYGGLNAVTYWASHERGGSVDARQNALMFGQGGALIERALEVAVRYADKLPDAEAGRAAYSNHATARAEFGALLGRPARIAAEHDSAAE